MRTYIKIADKIASAASVLVEISVFVIMMLTVADVILRHTARISIVGVTEYSQMLMAIMLLAAGATAEDDSHVKVDIVYNIISRKAKHVCMVVTGFLSMFIAAGIASRAYYETARGIQDHVTYITLQWPQWPFYLIFAIAMTVLFFAALATILKEFQLIRNERREDKTNG